MPAASDGLVCGEIKNAHKLQSPQEPPASGFPCNVSIARQRSSSSGRASDDWPSRPSRAGLVDITL